MKTLWRAIRNRFPFIEFLVALLVASVYAIAKRRFQWTMVPMLVRSVFLKQGRVQKWVEDERNKACSECIIFYEPLGTCGSPLMQKSFRHMGCHCHLKTKNRAHANCWAVDNGKCFGWPERLNSVNNGEINELIEVN